MSPTNVLFACNYIILETPNSTLPFGLSKQRQSCKMENTSEEKVSSVKQFNNHSGLRDELRFQDSLLMIRMDLSPHFSYNKNHRSWDLLQVTLFNGCHN
jgi:hypothetical protein